MDQNNNFFLNSQNLSDDYFPNHTEKFQNFGMSMDTQFTPNPTQSPNVRRRQYSQNIPQRSSQNLQQTSASNFTAAEDIALMSSWTICSEDPIIGKNQTSFKLWDRILNIYQQTRAENSEEMGEERTTESLRNRYKRLNTNATKWMAAYKEAYARRRSGMSKKDIEKMAQTIYKGTGTKPFTDLDVYEKVMRHHPKWELKLEDNRTRSHPDNEDEIEEGHGSSKKSRTEEGGEDPVESIPATPVSDASTIHRPIGREQAKAQRKAKGKAPQSSFLTEEFTSEIRNMRITREKEIDTMKELAHMRMKS